jgi:hypothetical protein
MEEESTTPKWMQPDFSDIKVGTGTLGIYVNGKLVKRVNGIVAVDPASHKATTFMPIWYVMQILNDLYIQSSWENGTTWNMWTDNNMVDYTPEENVISVDEYLSNLDASDDYDGLVAYLYATGNVTYNGANTIDSVYLGGWSQYASQE